MKRWPWCVAVITLALPVGCSREKPSANTPTTASADPAASNSDVQVPIHGPGLPATASGPVVIADTGNPQATLTRLSTELRRYVVRTQTAPKNFDDFVAKAQVQAPAPPPGKKYALQSGAVILVNR